MHTAANNPATNGLGPGISEADITEAVSRSGYPLQTVIARMLQEVNPPGDREGFHIHEEWGYIDRDSRELRAIDILAQQRLFDFGSRSGEKQSRVRPILNLMVESKQSTLPYVFFLSQVGSHVRYFPLISGLPSQFIEIASDDDPSTWTSEILMALDLYRHPFLSTEPEYCATFSKCVRRGNTLELSGSEPFNDLILPLWKSMQHFQVVEAPPKTAAYFDCHMVIGIGILDAPMISVKGSAEGNQLKLLPWVRVIRYETDEVASWHETKRGLYAIDIVHKDFFKQYLGDYVFPFAENFSRLTFKHAEELASGKAFAAGMGENGLTEIEERLRPRKTGERSKSVGKHLLSLALRRKSLD